VPLPESSQGTITTRASPTVSDRENAIFQMTRIRLDELESTVIHHADGRCFHGWTFGSALGQLRGTFGIHVAKIAALKLDVEDRLASIVPANAEAETADNDRLFRRLYL
jgi:hypothetical protein